MCQVGPAAHERAQTLHGLVGKTVLGEHFGLDHEGLDLLFLENGPGGLCGSLAFRGSRREDWGVDAGARKRGPRSTRETPIRLRAFASTDVRKRRRRQTRRRFDVDHHLVDAKGGRRLARLVR